MDTAQAVELAGNTRIANEKFAATEEEKKRQAQMDLLGSEQRSKMDLLRSGAYQDQEKLKLTNQLALPETTAKIGQANALAGYYGAETKHVTDITPYEQNFKTAQTNLTQGQATKASLDNAMESKLQRLTPTSSLMQSHFDNMKVTNPYAPGTTSLIASPVDRSKIPSMLPVPAESSGSNFMNTLFPSQAPDPNAPAFVPESPFDAIKKVGNKFADWMTTE